MKPTRFPGKVFVALMLVTWGSTAAHAAQGPAAHDAARAARAEIDRGNAIVLSDPAGAIRRFEAALKAAEQSGDRTLQAQALLRLAYAYRNSADWSRILQYVQRASELTPDADMRTRAQQHILRCYAYEEARQRDLAESNCLEALRLARRLGDARLATGTLNSLGLIYLTMDRDKAKALRHYDEAIATARSSGHLDLLPSPLNNSANLFRDDGPVDEALRRYGEALALSRRFNDSTVLPFVLKNIGRIQRRSGDYRAAEPTLREAVEWADRTGAGRPRWQARMELAQLYQASKSADADRYFRETLDVIEAQHRNVLLEGFRAGAMAGAITLYEDPYDLYISFLVDRGETDRAFQVAERARARAFLDTLTWARQEIASSVSKEYMEAERALLRAISDRQAALRANPMDKDRLLAEIRSDEERLAAHRLKLASQNPALANARYPHLWNASDLRRRLLGPDDVLVMFFLGDRASKAWIVRQDGLETVGLPGRRQIEETVRGALDALSTPSAAYDKEMRAVARVVGLEALRVPAGTRLVIVPHGILHYLPFEALIGANGRFLVEDYTISYAPSVSSYAFLRERRAPLRNQPAAVVAIGDPKLEGDGRADERGIALATVGLLKPLPFSGAEVRAVTSLFSRAARSFVRDEAIEANLHGNDLERASILHFATHGIVDEDHPERSGLALTAAPPSDGILQMREIYGLKLGATLVTLSACQTALGKSVSGEGIIGLARAFFYAGANAVVASLWNVSDVSTVSFMTAFYRALARGDAIDEAARAAKLAALAPGSRVRHPYYWAAFIVTGNAGVGVPPPPMDLRVAGLVGMVAGVLLVIGVAAVTVRSRRRG